MYTTKITSQGTISIPSALRKKYNLKKGEQVVIEDTGELIIRKPQDLASLREKNSAYLPQAKKAQKNDSGFTKHIEETYGA